MNDLARQLRAQVTEPHINETQDVQMGRTVLLELAGERRAELIRSPGTSVGARMVTTHIWVNPPGTPDWPADVGARSLPLVARLRWGNGAGEFRAELDVKGGAVASLVASYLDVIVEYEPQLPPAIPDRRAVRANVSAALVWGTRGGWSDPTRTRRLTLPDADTVVTVQIPPWAHSVALLSSNGAWYASADTITLHGGPDVTDDPTLSLTPVIAGGAPTLASTPGLELANTSRFLTINHAAGLATEIAAVFYLAL